MAGMVALLTLCGWLTGGDEAAQQWVLEASTLPHEFEINPQIMWRRFGARAMQPKEARGLFALLQDISRRAGLPVTPDLYLLDSPMMNAYALGGPHRSAITLTSGLLAGMSMREVAGILAHEVAHIHNNDGWSMRWAAGLHRTIATTSMLALASTNAHSHSPMGVLLRSAPAVGQLLVLALSRIRELDADALAMDLVDHPLGLVEALHKLERHHNGDFHVLAMVERTVERFLDSHPTTLQRIALLSG
jgi:heat shock protein HtpX